MKILRQKGFSLPELIIAMGLMGGISLVIMKIIEQQSSNEALIKGQAEISKAVAVIQNTLNNTKTCGLLFAKEASPTTIGSTLPFLEYTDEYRDNSTVPATIKTVTRRLIETGKNYNNLFTMGQIRVENSQTFPNIAADLVLEFQIRRRAILAFGDANDFNTIRHRVPFVVTRNASNQIQNCGPLISDANTIAKQKFCESMGPAVQWNPGPGTCTPRNTKCDFGQVTRGFTKVGDELCEDIERQIDLHLIFDTSTTCNSTSNGQYSVQANGTPHPAGGPARLRINCH